MKDKEKYTCYMCKHEREGYSGRCDGCKEWNTMVAESEKKDFKMPKGYSKFNIEENEDGI